MKYNQNIKTAANKFTAVLCVFAATQLIFTVILNLFLKKFLAGLELSTDIFLQVRIAVDAFIIIASSVTDIALVIRIRKTKSLLGITPIKCTVESYVVTKYRLDNDNKYNVDLLLRTDNDENLYFSYGKYNLSYYNFYYSKSGEALSGIRIFRKDGSPVNVGETVYLYLKRHVDVKVKVTGSDKRRLRLNNKRIRLAHIDKRFNINDFTAFTFYEGAVEVENIS